MVSAPNSSTLSPLGYTEYITMFPSVTLSRIMCIPFCVSYILGLLFLEALCFLTSIKKVRWQFLVVSDIYNCFKVYWSYNSYWWYYMSLCDSPLPLDDSWHSLSKHICGVTHLSFSSLIWIAYPLLRDSSKNLGWINISCVSHLAVIFLLTTLHVVLAVIAV
jgi:hypothetical protein